MTAYGLSVFLLLAYLGCALALPYRKHSSRSVPGFLKTSSGPSEKDYLAAYLEVLDQQYQQEHQQQPPAQLFPNNKVSEYNPVYEQGYVSRRPHVSPKTGEAHKGYFPKEGWPHSFGGEPERGVPQNFLFPPNVPPSEIDYNYDYNVAPSAYYPDDDGTWYDTPMNQDYTLNLADLDTTNQDDALLRLYIDHLYGKYSLEDLETLERQAAIEDNTENELQNLMPQKKSFSPLLGSRGAARKLIGFPRERQGQKEEALLVPVSSVRKPVFTRSPPKIQKLPGKGHPETSTRATATKSVKTAKEESTKTAKVTSKVDLSRQSTTSMPESSTTMEPAMKSAYEDFLHYLDQERYLRKAADDAKHTPQKRFVSEPQTLTQQLVSLKKTIT